MTLCLLQRYCLGTAIRAVITNRAEKNRFRRCGSPSIVVVVAQKRNQHPLPKALDLSTRSAPFFTHAANAHANFGDAQGAPE